MGRIMYRIDLQKCSGRGLCAEVHPSQAIRIEDKQTRAYSDHCQSYRTSVTDFRPDAVLELKRAIPIPFQLRQFMALQPIASYSFRRHGIWPWQMSHQVHLNRSVT